MSSEKIAFAKPYLDETEYSLVQEVLLSGRLAHGPKTTQFEKEFAQYIGSTYAISVSNCTSGMYLSLLALGIGHGDKVALPAMTHVATAHAIELSGAKPVFVDVNPQCGTIDITQLRSVIDDVQALIVVHHLGMPCDMQAIQEMLKDKNIFVIEDCAPALGAVIDNTKSGLWGHCGVFSFYPTKHITTMEGGMVTTNSVNLRSSLHHLRSFGYNKQLDDRKLPGNYDIVALGANFRLSEVAGAIGLCQMRKLDTILQTRRNNDILLRKSLQDVTEISMLDRVCGQRISASFCLNISLCGDNNKLCRDSLSKYLLTQGIETSIHYPQAVPMYSYYREKYGFKTGQFKVAEKLASTSLSLPLGMHIDVTERTRITCAIKQYVKKYIE